MRPILSAGFIKMKQIFKKGKADIPNPSSEARMTSPGINLKNFCAGLELITVLVTKPVTFRTPDRIEFATLLDIFVTLLALRKKIEL
jgi:hypothetical protein